MSEPKLCRTKGCGKRVHAQGTIFCLCHDPARQHTGPAAGTMRRKYDLSKWDEDFANRPGAPEWTPYGRHLLAALTEEAADPRSPLRIRGRLPQHDDRANTSHHASAA